MITIHDAKYHDFSEQLKVDIETKFSNFITFCKEFYKNTDLPYKENMTTFIRKTDYMNSYKSKDYFIVELDNHTLLDLYGCYDKASQKLYDLSFKTIVYRHGNWISDSFHDVKFNEEERNEFLTLEKEFYSNIGSIGIRGVIVQDEYNPDRDTIPESVIDFTHKRKSMEEFLEDTVTLEKFFQYYYEYCYTVKEKFNKLTSHIK